MFKLHVVEEDEFGAHGLGDEFDGGKVVDGMQMDDGTYLLITEHLDG